MTEETAIAIPDDVRTAFTAFDDDYLADVLRLWDCDLRKWHDSYATIFRFESDDILIWREEPVLKCWRGAIDDRDAISFLPISMHATIDKESCLCWISDNSYNALIGETTASQRLLSSFC